MESLADKAMKGLSIVEAVSCISANDLQATFNLQVHH